MQDQNRNEQLQNKNTKQPLNNTEQNNKDERDEKIKNEPDTARIRSERQSVIDGEKEGSNEQ